MASYAILITNHLHSNLQIIFLILEHQHWFVQKLETQFSNVWILFSFKTLGGTLKMQIEVQIFCFRKKIISSHRNLKQVYTYLLHFNIQLKNILITTYNIYSFSKNGDKFVENKIILENCWQLEFWIIYFVLSSHKCQSLSQKMSTFCNFIFQKSV